MDIYVKSAILMTRNGIKNSISSYNLTRTNILKKLVKVKRLSVMQKTNVWNIESN